MALKLVKSTAPNAVGGFVPKWYAAYRDGATVKTIALGVPLRGHPPASGYIGDKGDDAFERSREKAQAELDKLLAAAKEKGEATRELAAVVAMKTGVKFKDPRLRDLGDLYVKRFGKSTPGHESTIRSGFTQFADFAKHPPRPNAANEPHLKKAFTLGEVTRELAVAFFRHVAADHSFSTVKRYSHRLAQTYETIFPGADNPFKGARLAAVGSTRREDEESGEKTGVETVVHHRPIDRAQLRQLYAAAKSDPMLYALAVTAASTGLRIGDCATLKWKDVDLNPSNAVIFLKTAKTKTTVAVPIFSYDPAAPDYEPDLGEFRRVLEAALAERDDGDRYVFPEAARLYCAVKKTDADGAKLQRHKWTHPGRETIYSRGKVLFARALFGDEPEDAELVEDYAKSPAEVFAAIAATKWTAERKRRVAEIYRRHADGEGYREIQKATGFAKSTISYDLGAVERLIGMRVKTRPSSKPSVRALLAHTRQERTAGKRSASIYSWHSLRGSFVVMMRDNGVPLDVIRELVGHTTVDMTLQYYNPSAKMAAETARRLLTRRNRPQAVAEAPQTRPMLTTAQSPAANADAAAPNLAALREAIAKLPPAQRDALVADIANQRDGQT